MSRILSIDFGRKRTGLAVTDTLQIVANGLCTVATSELEQYLADYFARESVERIVMGLPRQMNGQPSQSWQYIEPFLKRLHSRWPALPIELVDERYTSVLAQRAILESGVGRQRRREDKAMVDTVAATIILQSYLEYRTMPGFRPVTWPPAEGGN
jgi:putative holliday junction resolvase